MGFEHFVNLCCAATTEMAFQAIMQYMRLTRPFCLHGPHCPEVPSVPLTPGDPGAPSVPFTPGAPGVPSVPLLPATPGTPSVPFTPGAPSVPLTPGAPARPSAPLVPGPREYRCYQGHRENRLFHQHLGVPRGLRLVQGGCPPDQATMGLFWLGMTTTTVHTLRFSTCQETTVALMCFLKAAFTEWRICVHVA